MASTVVSSKTILVADDTAFVRDRFRSAIESAGHTALTAKTGAETIAHLRSKPAVDLVVLDARLPDVTGIELVKAIRNVDGRRLTVLVFSGTIANAREVRDLAALGVAGYVNEYSAAPHIVPALAPHLYPDNFNRRSSPRVVLGIPVQYRFSNTIAAALTLNLSHGGVAIRTTSPLESGAKVKLRFRLPGSRTDIDAEGRIAWTDRRVGMGVQFDRVEPAHQTLIDEFVDGHFFSNRKA
jgi:uncharacterized protein (TIGR02266 family)